MSPVDSVSPASEPAALAVDSGQTAIRVRSRHPQYFEHSFPGAITSRALLPQLADAVVAASRLAGRPFQLVTIGTTGLTDVGRPEAHDEEADLTLRWFPLAEAVEMVLDGTIVNSLAVAGILAAHSIDRGVRELRPVDAPWPDKPTRFAARRAGR